MFQLTNSWKRIIKEELERNYFKEIITFLEGERKVGKIIYPEEKDTFNALNLTNFEDIKVVILGQDPYHQQGQAQGLSFSVQDGIKIPPSLKNIYKEISNCYGEKNIENRSGNLEFLAKQGVLLLNAILTVEDSKPASHSKIGWENFTDSIIKKVSDERENIVFLLWGNFAQSKAKFIDSNKHLILETSHPSPLGSYRGFLGSKCFSEANKYLQKHNKSEISW